MQVPLHPSVTGLDRLRRRPSGPPDPLRGAHQAQGPLSRALGDLQPIPCRARPHLGPPRAPLQLCRFFGDGSGAEGRHSLDRRGPAGLGGDLCPGRAADLWGDAVLEAVPREQFLQEVRAFQFLRPGLDHHRNFFIALRS